MYHVCLVENPASYAEANLISDTRLCNHYSTRKFAVEKSLSEAQKGGLSGLNDDGNPQLQPGIFMSLLFFNGKGCHYLVSVKRLIPLRWLCMGIIHARL